jgi:hypothetical protein
VSPGLSLSFYNVSSSSLRVSLTNNLFYFYSIPISAPVYCHSSTRPDPQSTGHTTPSNPTPKRSKTPRGKPPVYPLLIVVIDRGIGTRRLRMTRFMSGSRRGEFLSPSSSSSASLKFGGGGGGWREVQEWCFLVLVLALDSGRTREKDAT